MNNVLKIVATTFFLLLCLSQTPASTEADFDAAFSGFQLLEEPLNPRSIAMGTAGTALSGYGFSFYNPAIPFLSDKSLLNLEYGQYPKADLKHFNFETIIKIPNAFFGLAFHSESIDDIYHVNVFGAIPTSAFSYQFSHLSLDLGYSQWEDFAVALCVNGIQERIDEEVAYAITVSAGLVYIPIPNHLVVGLSALNVGTSTPMLGPDTGNVWGDGEYLPFNSRLGVAWSDTLREFPYTVTMDVVYRNVYDKSKPFKRHIQDRFTVPVGLEVYLLPPLALRMGKRFNHPTEAFNMGIGLNSNNLSVDASFVIPKLIDDTELKWMTSITYYLNFNGSTKE